MAESRENISSIHHQTFNKAPFPSEVLQVPHNLKGRDFVVGDLHGHFRALNALLEQVNFNASVDRLFSVGDLVDRGPDSLDCVYLLEQPWFYSVLGNHEDICLQAVKVLLDKVPEYRNANDIALLDDYKYLYEGEWLFDLDIAQLSSLIPLLSVLPVIITIGDTEQKTHIVHAELHQVDDREVVDSDIKSWHTNPIPSETRARCLSGRSLYHSTQDGMTSAMRSGLSLTYCGHTSVHYKLQHASHRFVDSGGCFSSGWFSLLEINTDHLVTHNFTG